MSSEVAANNQHIEDQAFDDPEQAPTIEMQRRLLAKTKTDKTNTLLKKSMLPFDNDRLLIDVYDNVGSNGIFGANPSVVKFAGFETMKTHTLKVRLINNSPAP